MAFMVHEILLPRDVATWGSSGMKFKRSEKKVINEESLAVYEQIMSTGVISCTNSWLYDDIAVLAQETISYGYRPLLQ